MTDIPLPAQGSTGDPYPWFQEQEQVADDVLAGLPLTIRTVTGNTTLALTDEYVRTNSASAITVTVPPNSTVAFPVGIVLQVRRHGAGAAVIAAGAGVTLNGALSGAPQFGSYALIKVATDTWDVEGGF